MRLFSVPFNPGALVLTAFALWFCPTLAHAQSSHSSPAYWEEQIAKAPESALNYFNLGVSLHKQNQYKEALAAYEKVIALKSPLAPVALYYEAQIYELQNQRTKAKAAVSAIAIESVPPTLKKKVLALKNRLFLDAFNEENPAAMNTNAESPAAAAPPSAKPERNFAAQVDFSFGQNSNPQTISDVSSSSISADRQTQLKASASYQPSSSAYHDLKLQYSYSGTFFNTASASNYDFHDVLLPLALYYDTYRLKIAPEFFTDSYGSATFSQSIGGTVELTKRIESSYVSLSLQHQSIKNLTSNYSYLTGSQQRLQLSVQSQWSRSRSFVNGYLGKLNYQDTSTLTSSYSVTGISGGYTFLFLPFDLGVVLLLENHSYAKATSDTSARSDLKTYADLQAGYNWNSNFRIYLDANIVNNDSNFNTASNNRSYKQMIYLVGVSCGY